MSEQAKFSFAVETPADVLAETAARDNEREIYRVRLAEKLKDPAFRNIEGFPKGTDEAILALSDPPYYTACPNPFIEEWLAENGKPYDATTDTYHREPFAADVSEGKNDPIYNAHSYHTKVPHKAIMRYILHYTEPGDVIYDGFCGTGMTGVAAQMCGNKAQVEALGYQVQADGTILDEDGKPCSKLGPRKAILNDLSPAATFIAYNYNTPVDAHTFEHEAKRVLAEVEAECGWMYSTLHDASEAETARVAEAISEAESADELRAIWRDLQSGCSYLRDARSNLKVGRINYTVWSDVFVCPNCGGEIVFWDAAVDEKAGKVCDEFSCPTCRAEVTKRNCSRAKETHFDAVIQETVTQARQVPVLLNYTWGKKRYEYRPDATSASVIAKSGCIPIPYWFPTDRLPKGYNTEQPKQSHGITHTHHFYTGRNLYALAMIWSKLQSISGGGFLFTATVPWANRQNRFLLSNYFQKRGGVVAPALAGTLYVSSISIETNPIYRFELRQNSSSFVLKNGTARVCSRSGTQATEIADNSVNYIFTDPPFGGNLMYSELNTLWESWLRVRTDNTHEAITNDVQKKKLPEYQSLMTKCFAECYRVLKSGHWMTVEFHNSANAVWNAIQEGLDRVGFIVADVRVLDKTHKTFKQVTASGAVKADLVISCYKPRSEFEIRFRDLQGKPESAIEFVRQHLSMLPVTPLSKDNKIEPVTERNRFLLFDRMIAYHLQKNAPIPLDAAPFYKMLEEQFTCRDEMYFLPEQAARFDALKLQGMETEQLSIFVQDEKTAVQWVRGALAQTPQTLGDLTPTFMQELRDWPVHEPRPELKDLLREYFIHSDGVWRVPNPDDEKDIEQLRKNALLRLFRDYTQAKGPLKVFRKEAIIQGFTTCYETNQHGVIVALCEKIPEKIRDEIQEFVMFYDIAKSLAPPEIVQTEFVFE